MAAVSRLFIETQPSRTVIIVISRVRIILLQLLLLYY